MSRDEERRYIVLNEIQKLMLCHYKKYPQMRITDVFKLLYQNEFGCGHMIANSEDSLNMILEEAAELKSYEHEAAEPIGNGLCRLYLSVLRSDLSAETLNRFFIITANQPRGNARGFEEKAAAFKLLCENGGLPFNAAEVARMMSEYRAANYPAMRHSPQYRQAYAAFPHAALPPLCIPSSPALCRRVYA